MKYNKNNKNLSCYYIISDISNTDVTIKGEIKVNKKNDFGFFSMNKKDVLKSLSFVKTDIENIIKAKHLSGKFDFCRFDDHDSNDSEYIRHFLILQVIYRSTY